MSIGLCCVSMPALLKLLGPHLPPFEKVKSWLHSRYIFAKHPTLNCSFRKAPALGKDVLLNKIKTPNMSRDSDLDIERDYPGRLDQDTSSSPYDHGSMEKSVRTIISSRRNKMIDNDDIEFDIELQQHSR